MEYYIVIPAHNEEATLAITLQSILNQTLPAKKVVVVDDNSADSTKAVIRSFSDAHPTIIGTSNISGKEHIPGAKVVRAFNKGLELLDEQYDFLVKLDADLVLPKDYFMKIADLFSSNAKCGIAGGFAYERTDQDTWMINHPMNKDHVRGGFKAYRKACFEAIDGLRATIGWDTVDELLALYHGYEVHTAEGLKVLHLRPTGRSYRPGSMILQGEAFYRMRYGILISLIATLKMAWKQKDIRVIWANHKGYWRALRNKVPRIVSPEEGSFIRRYRWKKILGSLI